uniref:Uncharacterized protein n=1 Tax=Anopheles minimus TaxID=112268 RepID=A0A182WPL0_9DIPT
MPVCMPPQAAVARFCEHSSSPVSCETRPRCFPALASGGFRCTCEPIEGRSISTVFRLCVSSSSCSQPRMFPPDVPLFAPSARLEL